MARARSFVFDKHGIESDNRTLNFAYRIDFDDNTSLHFVEHLTMPVNIDREQDVVVKLMGALHIGLGMSYYKLFLPPNFDLNGHELSVHEAGFWNFVYLNGLAEFLYTNRLDPARLAKFKAGDSKDKLATLSHGNGVLLALGGGKDSIVAGELLKTLGLDLSTYVLATGDHHGQTSKVAVDMNLDLLVVKRQIDPMLLELNTRDDVYNGHIPISMVFALTGLLLCVANHRNYLVVGNESSASIPNTHWHSLVVNHQWSKSFEFEQALQQFVHTTISDDLCYFSAIRPLSSVAVAKLFAAHPEYFGDFTSCNRVFAIDPAKRPNNQWCGQCDKCLSSFIILAPWVAENDLIKIFSKNMLDDSEHTNQFLALTGLEGHKPLDCVGTEEEIVLSINMAFAQTKFKDTVLMKLAKERGVIRADDWQDKLDKAITITKDHSFPTKISKELLQAMKASLA